MEVELKVGLKIREELTSSAWVATATTGDATVAVAMGDIRSSTRLIFGR